MISENRCFWQLVAVLGCLSLALPANAQRVEYRGGGFLTDFSSQCPGWRGISQILVRSRPAGVGSNDPQASRLSLFFPIYAYHIHLPPQTPVGDWVDAPVVAGIGSGADWQREPEVRPQFRLLPTPAGTTLTEEEAHFVFEIENFDYTRDCRVRGNILLHRR